MDKVLFNFHDIILILTSFECLLFALLIFVSEQKRSLSSLLFIGLLLCHTLIPLHELTFWGKELRFWLVDLSPNLFFLGSYSYYLDGPILYFFVRALLYKDVQFRRHDWLHLVPIGIFFALMVSHFYLLDHSTRYSLIESQHIAYSSPFLYFEAASKYLRLGYAGYCFILLHRYGSQLKDTYADIHPKEISWLMLASLTILGLFAWDAMVISVKLVGLITQNFDLELLNIIGLGAYYLNFVALNLLIFLKFTSFKRVKALTDDSTSTAPMSHAFTAEEALQIHTVMEKDKVYAMDDLTINKLADALSLPAKKVSVILRDHYNMNFYEFINHYRIQAAKKRLVDKHYEERTITDIFYEVGFNSKSVFNTFFKRIEGMTPSEYRDKHKQPASRTKLF